MLFFFPYNFPCSLSQYSFPASNLTRCADYCLRQPVCYIEANNRSNSIRVLQHRPAETSELPPDRNIQNLASPFLTMFRMIYDARVVHVRQCKLNEPLSWARYFYECLQRNYCCTCLVKKIDSSSLSREEMRGSLLIQRAKSTTRVAVAMALFIRV